MTSFVFLGNRNFNKILSSLESLNLNECNVFFLTNTNKKVQISSNSITYKVMTFDSYSTDNEMLEYFFQNEKYQDVFVVKSSYENVNIKDFEKILKQAHKKDVIITKQNKNSNVFTKIWQKIKHFYVKYLFGFNLYKAEADIVYLSSLATSIIKQSPQRSARFVNTNAWSGLDPLEVTIAEQPKIKKKSNKHGIAGVATLALASLALIVGNVLFAVLNVKIPFLAYVAYILVEVAIIAFTIFYITKLIFNKKYGKLNLIKEAILVDVKEG